MAAANIFIKRPFEIILKEETINHAIGWLGVRAKTFNHALF